MKCPRGASDSVFFEEKHVVGRLSWHRTSQSDEELREYLILALLRSRACVTFQDEHLHYHYIANLPAIWNVQPDEIPADTKIFGEALGGQLNELKKLALQTGEQQKQEVQIESDKFFEFHIESIQSVNGQQQVMTTIVDMSETRRREKVLKVLLREVSHRSKNLLAIIQSIATQTARNSNSLDHFLAKFRGRIFSLSQSQDLVTDSNWRGAFLHDLIHDQVSKYQQHGKPAVRIGGENILLSPNAALHIGLALHELMVNAVSASHAMSGGKTIDISCRVLNGTDAELSWREPADISPEAPPLAREINPRSFGSTVLERVVPASVSGSSQYTIDDDGVEYILTFPLSDENVSGDER